MSEIQKGYFLAYGRYGSPSLSVELNKRNVSISKTTTAKYMRELGLQSKLTKKFKVTTDSKHDLNIAPNILNREFTPPSASTVWVSDITYIYTLSGFIYLTTVIDLYDRKVIGWSVSSDMTTQETVIKGDSQNAVIFNPAFSYFTSLFHYPRNILMLNVQSYACAQTSRR